MPRTIASPPGRPAACLLALTVAVSLAGCGSDRGPGSPAPPASPRGSLSGATVTPAAGRAASTDAFDPAGLAVGFDEVASGLSAPLAIANAHDGSGRLYIAQQGGQIRIVRDGALAPLPFLDVAERISSGGERGLLGVAFHPRYPVDPRVFVDYTDPDGNTRVSSFRVDPATPDRVDPATEQRLLFVQQPFPNHNGGALAFGPDGFLYISLGDGGSAGDPQGNGQSLKTLLGKILRIDVDRNSGDRAYGIPADNPFAAGDGGAQPEIWLLGLRNPWRMSFDRATGDLWIGDVGQDAWEEVDVQRAGATGGTNFGWNRMEGTHCFRPAENCLEGSLTLPITDYGHDQGCTVIGGDVYRGSLETALLGGYVFADYCSGRVWAIDPASSRYQAPTLVAETSHAFSAFGANEDGEMFAVDINAGTLLRVTATRR
jgi:glucose/arabinose dehydrogenase